MRPKVISVEKARFTDWFEKALDVPLKAPPVKKPPERKPNG